MRNNAVMRNTRKAATLGTLLAGVLLTGCFDYESRTEVGADGSGSMTLSVQVDTERASGLTTGMTGGDVSAQTPVQSPQEVCAEFFSDADTSAAAGIELVIVNEPDDCSLTATVRWQAGESAQEKLDLLANMSREEGEPAGESLVTLDGSVEEGWRFAFNVGNLQEAGTGESPDAAADEQADMMMRVIGMAAFEGKALRVSVKLPGTITDHNGTLENGTVSWEIPMYEAMTSSQEILSATAIPGDGAGIEEPAATETIEPRTGEDVEDSGLTTETATAETSTGGSGGTAPLLWVGVGAGVLLLAAGAFFLTRRN